MTKEITADNFFDTDLEDIEATFLNGKKITALPKQDSVSGVPTSSRSPVLLTNGLSQTTLGELVSKAVETGQIVVVKSDEIQLLPPEAAKELRLWLDEHRAELVAASAQFHSVVVS